MLIGGVQVGWGRGVGERGDECLVIGGDGERLLPKLFPSSLENIDKRSLFKYVTTLAEKTGCLHTNSLVCVPEAGFKN